MDEGKRRNIIIAISIIYIVVLGTIMHYKVVNRENKDGITAMEAKVIADKLAINWSENATLIYVHGTQEPQNNGRYMAWGLTYAKSVNSNISMGIHVFSDSRAYKEIRTRYSFQYVILNWTIDSDEAYSIAMKNEKIKAYMRRYDAHVDSFYLAMPSENATHPVWTIYFSAGGVDYSPHNAHIIIDATTGEVLYAEADLTSYSLTRVLYRISSLVIVVAIVVLAVLIKKNIGRKRKEKIEVMMERRKIEKEIRKEDEKREKRR